MCFLKEIMFGMILKAKGMTLKKQRMIPRMVKMKQKMKNETLCS
jgi:hypothetical protein